MSFRATQAIALVEARRLIRSRMALTLILIVPLLQIVLFGYAIRPGEAAVRVAVAAPTPQSAREVVEALSKLKSVEVVGPVGPPGTAEAAVRNGGAKIGIEVPAMRSFANPTAPGGPVRIIVDATDPLLTMTAVARIENAYLAARVARSDMADVGPEISVERLFNPDLRSEWTFAPALAGVTTMITMVMLGSIGIAREREGGSWETLRSLPIAPAELVAGKLLPHVLVGTMQGAIVLLTGHLLFALPLPLPALALLALLPIFAAAHYLIGFVISARATTQLSALQGAVAFYLPAMLLSGFLYPFETLPKWAQAIGNLFPLSHFIRAAHDAVLRERDAATILAHGLPMIAFVAIAAVLAAIVSRHRTADL